MSAGGAPVLVAEGVHVAYAGRPVLDVAAFAVHEGEVLAVIGPNGAGKSTLLRVLALLETPVRGTVAFRGVVPGSRERPAGAPAPDGLGLPGAAPL